MGELSIRGPNGRGQLMMPNDANTNIDMDFNPVSVCTGSILSGSFGGNWENMKINHGNILMNQTFDKFPNQFGQQSIDNQTKWMSLFTNWEHDVFDGKKFYSSIPSQRYMDDQNATARSKEIFHRPNLGPNQKVSQHYSF